MMITINKLKGYTLLALDGEIGKVREFYFDDQHWTIRYLVADTGNWLTGRQVLISPYAFMSINTEKQQFLIDLTKKQIEDSPSLDSDKPVSKQFELVYYSHYGYPVYWGGANVWGFDPYLVRDRSKWGKAVLPGEKEWDPSLRSTHAVSGYHIEASDGSIGHVDDFIIDDKTWMIRYLVINTRNWLPGKQVLVSPRWIDRVGWEDSTVFVNLPREAIKQAPEFTEGSQPTRDYEAGLHKHYGQQGYWVDEPEARDPKQ